MEHEEIRALIEAAADSRLDEAGIELMKEHLSTCPACRNYAQDLALIEARLYTSLQSRYTEESQEALLFAETLEGILVRSRRDNMTRGIYRTAAWVGIAAVFIFTISWAIRNTAPQKPSSAGQTTDAAPTNTPVPSPTQTTNIKEGDPQGGTSAIFPNAMFILPAQLPEAPGQVILYAQDYPEAANPENIARAASRLITGGVISRSPGEGSDPVYNVIDDFHRVTFAYNSPELLNYFSSTRLGEPADGEDPVPFDQAVEIVTAFFAERSLLPDKFRGEPVFGTNTGVHLRRLLDGHPLVYGIGFSPSLVDLEAFVAPDGSIVEAHYADRTFRPLLELPIRSAAEAWQVFLNKDAPTGYRYVVNPPEKPNNFRIWERSYPTGERIDLYGYRSVFEPLLPAGQAMAFLTDWPVTGDLAASYASQDLPSDFLHAWGQLQADEQGRLTFQIEGWEVSPNEDMLPSGKIEIEGEQAYLVTDQGRYLIKDAPIDLEQGMEVNARGVSPDGKTFDWSYIDNNQFQDGGYSMLDACAGGGGGGGDGALGGGTFLSLQPQGASQPAEPSPTTFIPPSPFQQGQSVEAARGYILSYIHIYKDGAQALEVYLRSDPWDNFGGFGQYWQARLEGDQVESLTRLYNLPVKVWGRVDGVDAGGYPIIKLGRYEEVDPGLRHQTWQGTWQLVTLEGKEVLLLTADDSKQYILSGSLQYGKDSAIGREGDNVVIQGLAEPGKSFGGYPVITELGGSIVRPGEVINFPDQSMSVYDERGAVMETESAASLKGVGTVTRVELAYAASSLQQCGGIERVNDPTVAPWLYVQPIWRFSGLFEDGRPFEIQVQALRDEYLSQP